jgi:hypothetical protein
MKSERDNDSKLAEGKKKALAGLLLLGGLVQVLCFK